MYRHVLRCDDDSAPDRLVASLNDDKVTMWLHRCLGNFGDILSTFLLRYLSIVQGSLLRPFRELRTRLLTA